MSSGLRINTAADDPSGLAVAESLSAKVNGLDQGVQSLQDANNALNVADGALSAISSILQRLRALIVQSNSDYLSKTDRADLQTEIDQLTAEIDKIAQNTTFNGRQLLDGSASSKAPLPAQALIVVNDGLAGGGTLLDTTLDPGEPAVSPGSPQLVQTITINSFDPVANQLSVTSTLESTDPGFGSAQPPQTFTVDNNTNFPSGYFPPTPGTPTFTQSTLYNPSTGTYAGPTVLSFNIGTLTAADVGKTATIVTISDQVKAPGEAIQVNSGDAEGSTISVDIPAVNTINLGVSNLQLGDGLETQAAEYRVDYGITALANIRAQVGAQTVALQDAVQNGSNTAVQLQASESNVRDLDVAKGVAQLTRDQILASVQNSVLSTVFGFAPQVLQLVQGARA